MKTLRKRLLFIPLVFMTLGRAQKSENQTLEKKHLGELLERILGKAYHREMVYSLFFRKPKELVGIFQEIASNSMVK